MSEKKKDKVMHHEAVPFERPKKCVGELCYNPKTQRLEFDFDRAQCPREVLDKIVDQTPMTIKMKAPKVIKEE
jgi:hypothetical protein